MGSDKAVIRNTSKAKTNATPPKTSAKGQLWPLCIAIHIGQWLDLAQYVDGLS
jgi:hypothetical protein